MRIFVSLVLSLLACASLAAAQDVTVRPGGISFKELAGTPTLVTVVLSNGAEVPNLRITELMASHFMALAEDGKQHFYLFENVDHVLVQGGKVEKTQFKMETARKLRGEEQQVVERALLRSREIFATANDNQELKIQAAMLLTLNGDEEARTYLWQLINTDDVQTAMAAARALYLAVGDPLAQEDRFRDLLGVGLNSGNLSVRALAAQLTGMAKVDVYTLELMRLISDRAVEYSAPAARSLARLGNRDIIPRLLGMITELNDQKGEAAIFGLIRLGGDEVIEGVKNLLPDAPGQIQFRIARVLLALDDPLGKEMMIKIMSDVPTLADQAALQLAQRGDWDAMTYVRRQISEPADPTDDNLTSKASASATLIAGGDVEGPMAVLQELLRSESVDVHEGICRAVTRIGKPSLVTILQSPIENVDQEVALKSCIAAMALGRPEFRDRLLDIWDLP